MDARPPFGPAAARAADARARAEYVGVPGQQVFGIKKKVEVMQTSLEKVERGQAALPSGGAHSDPDRRPACYAVTVRGSEYPKELLAKFLQQADGEDAGPPADD